MDERIFQFKSGQAIPEWDLRHRLHIQRSVGPERKDSSTIFRINSSYMDVTDQPYRDRQWQAAGVLTFLLGIAASLFYGTSVMQNSSNNPDSDPIMSIFLVMAAISMLGFFSFKYGRDEFFSLKRRPIRFDRKQKKIYAIRRRRFFAKPGQGDITWEVPWDENAIFCIHRGVVHHRHVYHIRHYEVDQDGNVLRAFSIGRKWEGDESLEDLLSQWNYWCWYMNHGPAELPKPLLFFKEKENMLESFLFCMYDFGMRASAAYRIIMMPAILLMTSHRLMALWTCRAPIWPDAVVKVSAIEPDDPFDQPSGPTPVGWAETTHAIDRNEYPDGDKREMKNWSGEKNPTVNALLWAKDVPPEH
ncbi:hypothetical protein G5B88_17225 [Herbaspirillum seropedicae]|uniref:DUF6708 domain-containing protein n=1 Tax=Herbaspirillum seropedicae (strain SmR1) TaxID=757424 RepID=D8IPJ2_HERSS|nr:DUF6708 domain-containing protein [Herbaspirillum seropedicae]ADJ64889.1 hypothetical protein Hsero_3408 [Herbaspirillum seropedicae SmR1]AKN66785.1 hypothetical protein ACP92_17045 [Herbaspirillum seropedicae]NQE28197.1 hypothetical protein [Herbaspirillum seropedicae]UMU22781.1 hypothetical protein G5B88_17225 [Herbaspirillum seropedicae]